MSKDDKQFVVMHDGRLYYIDICSGAIIDNLMLSNLDRNDILQLIKGLNMAEGKSSLVCMLLSIAFNIDGRVLCFSNDLNYIVYEQLFEMEENWCTYLYNTQSLEQIEISKGNLSDSYISDSIRVSDAAFSPNNTDLAYLTYSGQLEIVTIENIATKIASTFTPDNSGIYGGIGYLSSGNYIYTYSDRWLESAFFYDINNDTKINLCDNSLSEGFECMIPNPNCDNIFITGVRGNYRIFFKSTTSPFFSKIQGVHQGDENQVMLGENTITKIGNYIVKYYGTTLSVLNGKETIWEDGDCSDIKISMGNDLIYYRKFVRPNDVIVIKYISTGNDFFGDFYSIENRQYNFSRAFFNKQGNIVYDVDGVYYEFKNLKLDEMLDIAKALTRYRRLSQTEREKYFLF